MIAGVYAIVDVTANEEARALQQLDLLLDNGVRIVQLRAKSLGARRLLALARSFRAKCPTLIINDRPDVAVLAGADGVHLGQDDLAIADVRPLLPRGMMVGVSCHSIADVEQALASGADHLGYGPVFATATKRDHAPVVGLDGLRAAVERAGATPVIAIGGIDLTNLASVRDTGASAAAMIGALARDPALAARTLISLWGVRT